MSVPTPNVRAAAAKAVAAVLGGRNLDDALAAVSTPLSAADLSLLKALAYGVVRDWSALDWRVNQLLDKPLRNEALVSALLACGIHQLRAMRIPPHAAVAESVAAAEVLGKPWAKGLTNALLRRWQREADSIDARMPPDPEIRQSYPEWLVRQIKRDWPAGWRSVLAAGNTQAPMTLRVNRRYGERDAYIAALAAAGIGCSAPRMAADAVVLNEPLPV